MSRNINLRNSSLKLLVDDEDYEFISKFIWKQIKKRKDYDHVYSTHYGKIVRPHRLILNIEDPSILIDHINGNTLDNRKCNLRICTNQENSRNQGKRQDRQYTSKYKGVNWNKHSKKWTARIKTDKKRIFIGYFTNEIEAAKAYDQAALEHHKEFANLNFKG